MSRLMIALALVLGFSVLLGAGSAQAFTSRMGVIQKTESPFDFLLKPRRDIPTPQFFRIVIDAQTGTAVLEEPYVQPIIIAPELSIPVQPHSERSASRILPRYLSGIETLILRHVKTIVSTSQR